MNMATVTGPTPPGTGVTQLATSFTASVSTSPTITVSPFGPVIKKVIDRLEKPVEIHCHQDFGLGVANTVAALAAGASVAHTTITGLGERDGTSPSRTW